jgi:vesicular inhibitory amino acid transporter
MILYGSFGIIGYYLMFGDNLQSQIALNLPWEATSSYFVILVTLIIPFLKYALMVTPLAIVAKQPLPHHKTEYVFSSTIFGTLLVVSYF